MIDLLDDLKRNLGVTIVSATHDLKMLKKSDRILWIEDGRIARDARPDQVDFNSAEFH
jgi:putative ABC transport system ATP-binding protein